MEDIRQEEVAKPIITESTAEELESVFENKEKESGITIHYVNEKYDEGNILFQKKIPVLTADSADEIAAKIHKLEYNYFPRVIVNLLKSES